MNKKILVHICCLPCFLHPYQVLKDKGYDIIGYFYNPNIHPVSEYKKRLYEVEKFFRENNMKLIVDDYEINDYFNAVSNNGKRCTSCYTLRMERSFLKAKELGINTVTTTLFVSIHQPRKLIKSIGKRLEDKYGHLFLSYDFRLGYYEAKLIAKKRNIYYQKYCGCIFSENERNNDPILHTHTII